MQTMHPHIPDIPKPPLATPEDLHYPGPMAPDVLGRTAVLANDNNFGKFLAVERAVEATYEAQDNPEIASKSNNKDIRVKWQLVDEWREALDSLGTDNLKLFGAEGGAMVELEKARGIIRQIDQNTWGEFFDIIFDRIAPSLFKDQAEVWRAEHQGAESGFWLTWLGRESSEETDAQLTNFLQWHNHRIETLQQHPEFHRSIESESQHYLEKVEVAEREGWLADGSFQRANDLLKSDNIAHVVGDEFSQVINGWAACAARLKFTQFSAINGADTKRPRALVDRITKSSWHEFNHLVLGAIGHRWLDEALTEHISQVLKGERVLDDISPGDDGKAYGPERELLSTLVDITNKLLVGRHEQISARHFTLAYSGAYSKSKQEVDRLVDILKESHDFHILSAINNFLKYREDELVQEGVSKRSRQIQAVNEAQKMLEERPEQFREYLDQDRLAA